MKINYRIRIRAAAWISTCLHVLALVLAWWFWPNFTFGLSQQAGPLTITLLPSPMPEAEPQPRPEERQLVDVAQPATDPVRPTDLIAVQNSNASDTQASEGNTPGPKVDMASPVDSLGQKAAPTPGAGAPEPAAVEAPEDAPSPTPEATPEAAAKEEAPEKQEKPKPAPAPEPPTTTLAMAAPAATPPAETSAADAPASKPAEAAQTAAMPAPQAAAQPGGAEETTPTRGRNYRGVEKVGVRGFEALQDQIAPYLKNVEDAVERRWREALLTKYKASKAVQVQIDCEIGADGRIVSLKVNGTPDDRVYASLCKEAIEKAGPFGPFPFTVPEMYRNRNLEIRWSFNIL